MRHHYLEIKAQTGKPADFVGKEITCCTDYSDVVRKLDESLVFDLDIFHFLQGQVFINHATSLCFKIVGWAVEVPEIWKAEKATSQRALVVCKAFYSGELFTLNKEEFSTYRSATPQELRREFEGYKENLTKDYEEKLKTLNDKFEEFRLPKGLKMDATLRFFEKLRDVLEDANPECKVLIEMPDGHTFSWDRIGSYRGYYDEPTIGYQMEPTTVATVKVHVTHLLAGAEYSGYKGGLYSYNGYEGVVHIACFGHSSPTIAGAISVINTGDVCIHAVERN